jgi:hypothetical protein
MAVDVVVVGAGLSGLVAAHRLQRRGVKVRVLEATQRTGGVIGSERSGQVLIERGPNTALDSTGAIGVLIDELGIGGRLIEATAAASRRYLVWNGRLVALPASAADFLRTPVFSRGAKLRLFAEPLIRRAPRPTPTSQSRSSCAAGWVRSCWRLRWSPSCPAFTPAARSSFRSRRPFRVCTSWSNATAAWRSARPCRQAAAGIMPPRGSGARAVFPFATACRR